ncbi:maleate cis-trans isomerase [Nitriliruptor alkaliphilus]|uniref:maleate cis-trans isomerase family protein n=1 Tax=Nitriliruptor alkaliphilus TaxID=427918 RepID=UPI00316AD4F5
MAADRHDAGPVRLGFLYPGHAAEDDYPAVAAMLGPQVVVEVVHTGMGEDAHREDALLEIGGRDRLRPGAKELQARGVDVGVWACTSGSFVFGWDGARAQVDALSQDLGAPASSTSFAFVSALAALGITRVAVAATYPADVAQRFATFLDHAGVAVLATGSQGIVTAAEVGTLDADATVGFVAAGDHPEAQAILVPDTALHTVRLLDRLEARVGKPVLTANQVTVFEALRLSGRTARADGLGTLFAAGTSEPVTQPGR